MCVEGDIGYIYEGILDYEVFILCVDEMLELLMKIMMNVGNLDCVFDFVCLLYVGVGFVCVEFVINCMIGVYFKVFFNFDV